MSFVIARKINLCALRVQIGATQLLNCHTTAGGEEYGGSVAVGSCGSRKKWKDKPKREKTQWPIFNHELTYKLECDEDIQNVETSPIRMPDGFHLYVYKNGSKYAGFWKNGVRHGMGKLTHRNGNVYSGHWENGVKHGKGKIWLDGYHYDGSWEYNYHHGYGKQEFRNGDRFEGFFYENQRDGQGRLTYANGDTLEGTFKNGDIYSGSGVHIKNGIARIGEFQFGTLQSPGKIVYANGDVYEGGCANGRRDGQGRLVYADGKVLQGVFRKDSILHGEGLVRRVWDGLSLGEGRWQDGKLVEPAAPDSDSISDFKAAVTSAPTSALPS